MFSKKSSSVIIAVATLSANAHATPKPLPFTYGADTNPKGQGEVEQYVDLVPVKAQDAQGVTVPFLATQFQTEMEYGITNRVELGLYVTFQPESVAGYVQIPQLPETYGVKQRIRWRLADQGDWPIDIALYGEISESVTEIELEAKVILERRVGRFRFLANAWFEHEFYYTGRREWVFNPTGGITFQVTPSVHPGIEYWMRAEVLAHDDGQGSGGFNAGPHHYLGPTLRLSFGNFFWTTGIYARLSNIDHVMQANVDAYGPVWFRTVAGFGF
jgi:hypothetical protein